MIKYRVLVYPCSNNTGIEINNSLKNNKEIELFGLNIGYSNKGSFVYDNYFNFMGYKNEDKFIVEIKKFIDTHKINTIIPADDNTVIIFKNAEEYLNVNVITSPLETSLIVKSKSLTYQILNDLVLTPKIYNIKSTNLNDKFINKIIYPIFIYNDQKIKGKNSFIINNYSELKEKCTDKHIICEYLPGDEFTVECFTDQERNLCYSIPRKRITINSGLSVNTELLYDDDLCKNINNISRKINDQLLFQGVWFYQLKQSSCNKLVLLEISTRLPGSSSIVRNMGVNMTLLSIYDSFGHKLTLPKLNNFFSSSEKIYKNYFYCPKLISINNLYVDLIDTLIVKNKVNIELISIIYKFKNSCKNAILISKDKCNIEETLYNYDISKSLFNSIIKVEDGKEKKDYINDNSILIDNSFTERNSVSSCSKLNNVFVLDIDSIEILLNNKNI